MKTTPSKYTDLSNRIIKDSGTISTNVILGMDEALDWLDEHPEAVPELATAITRSQWDAATKIADQFVVADIANAWGLSIIDDPEPSNSEKLNSLYNRWCQDIDGMEISVGEWMEKHGVTAPGGDDE